jgi:hypothetical protein
MSARDRLALLAAELNRFPARDRRAILAALTPLERAHLASLLDEEADEARQDIDAIERGFSPPIAIRIGQARDPGGSASQGGRMTPAGRRLLLEAAQLLAARPRATSAPAARSRSLTSALVSLVSGRLGL